MLQIGLLLYARHGCAELAAVARARSPAAGRTRASERSRSAPRWPLLATIVAGGYMSASETSGAEGRPNEPSPHTACGHGFPSCGRARSCRSAAAARSTSTSPTVRSCT